MTFEDTCKEIDSLIARSCGSNILLPCGEEYAFERVKRYSLSELSEFENKFGINLPDEYKYFLMTVGSSKIYIDEYGLGIEFLSLERLIDFSNKVFENMKNPFPKLMIIASNIGRGDFISYGIGDDSQDYRLATLSHEEDPERWLQENTEWSTLRNWLVTLFESEGEEDTI
ncbi:MAG: SMI1/KNR4 family protein [Candidatus Thiodiazotropha taylori]|nr:SMI1/KNR4 family protein [Candidatus Thiodiazotropha endolucinida]MCW4229102.1 SMI1/KNR4 family protein [Candidatus Thiodiazotropha taylori]